MTHYVPYVILAVMLAATAFAQEPKAFHYLNETRDGVISAVKGLSEAQWNFKPAPDRWSVAEIVEHLALVEGFAKSVLDRMPQAPPPAAGFNAAEVDDMILARVPEPIPPVYRAIGSSAHRPLDAGRGARTLRRDTPPCGRFAARYGGVAPAHDPASGPRAARRL